MQILSNSLSVLGSDGRLIFLLLVCIGWGVLLAFTAIRKIVSEKVGEPELTALALAGWPGPLLLISLVFLLLTQILPLRAAGLLAVGLAVLSAVVCIHRLWKSITREILLPVSLFLVLVFLRLGYAADALLPAYFDSAWHYSLIQSILRLEHGAPLAWPLDGWYHPGYHLISAALVSFTGGSLARLMLIFGQISLAALPLPLYFFVRHSGGSVSAGLLAVTLAAFGWSMPAHAVDWGKYPALLSLLTIEFALGAALLGHGRMRAAGALAAQILHSRAIILVGLAVGSWLFSRIRTQWLMILGVMLLGIELILLIRDPLTGLVLRPYAGLGSIPALLLASLSFRKFRQAAMAALWVAAGMLGMLLLPITPGLTLLDRPLVEMALFMPLAFLGGLGSVGLYKSIPAAGIAFILLYSFSSRNLYPSNCCQLAGRDDLAALNWIASNLPPRAIIGIAGADLQLSFTGLPMQRAGSDAGIWVEPLTSRSVESLNFLTDFEASGTRDWLCARRVAYLYVGGKGGSFKLSPSDRYRTVFALPEAQIFEVICPKVRNPGSLLGQIH
jgi:hypothetical protein